MWVFECLKPSSFTEMSFVVYFYPRIRIMRRVKFDIL